MATSRNGYHLNGNGFGYHSSEENNFQSYRDSMINNENGQLRDRVTQLEKKVQDQEDELVCLRSSMADVLRRLSQLEGDPSSMTRSLTRSTVNLHNGGSTLSLASTAYDNGSQRRRPLSHSRLYKPTMSSSMSSHQNANDSAIGVPSPSPMKSRSNMMSPFGNPPSRSASTSNIKKWMASQDTVDSASFLTPSRNNLNSPTGRNFGSMSTLATSHSLRSLANVGVSREPSFFAEDGILRLFVRGRPVNLYAPSNVVGFDSSETSAPPKEHLKPEWIYGYRGKDCRSNLHFLPTGELIYFIAGAVILFNVEQHLQRHYLDHTDDVKCIAVHPNRLFLATGQATKRGSVKNGKLVASSEMESLLEESENLPHVRIWDSVKLQTMHVLGVGDFEKAVSCVAFSKTDGGSILAVVDDGYEHSLSVWDWQNRRKITEVKSGNDQVFACEFHPTEKNILVTCGKSQILFWTFIGEILQKKIGIFDGKDKPKYYLCIGFSQSGLVLSGDSNGYVSLWNASSAKVVKQSVKAHEGPIFALCTVKDGYFLTGGGKDRKLIEWDEDLNVARTTEVPDSGGPIRTITAGRGNMITVGTTHNCILQGSFELKFSFVMQGHMDEMWTVASHPQQQQFLSCGYDKMIRLWDALSKSCVWSKQIADPVHSIGFHPSCRFIAVGTTVGRWIVLDSSTREVVAGIMDSNEIIACVSYSPDGSLLAVGCHDCKIYVYAVSDDGRKYNRLGVCTGHNYLVKQLDWTVDSYYMRTNGGDQEVFYWQANNCKQITNSTQIRDFVWMTDNCTLCFNVAGVWPDSSDGGLVYACDRAHNGSTLATADEMGCVKLFRYPCSKYKSQFNGMTVHSNSSTSARFLPNDARLISSGGKDCSIIQWIVS